MVITGLTRNQFCGKPPVGSNPTHSAIKRQSVQRTLCFLMQLMDSNPRGNTGARSANWIWFALRSNLRAFMASIPHSLRQNIFTLVAAPIRRHGRPMAAPTIIRFLYFKWDSNPLFL